MCCHFYKTLLSYAPMVVAIIGTCLTPYIAVVIYTNCCMPICQPSIGNDFLYTFIYPRPSTIYAMWSMCKLRNIASNTRYICIYFDMARIWLYNVHFVNITSHLVLSMLWKRKLELYSTASLSELPNFYDVCNQRFKIFTSENRFRNQLRNFQLSFTWIYVMILS